MRIGKVIREVLSVGLLLTAGFHNVGHAQQNPESARDNFSRGVKNIVLVHGSWADGSSWSGVIPLLEKDGYHVIAVQLPLMSLANDDAVTERDRAHHYGIPGSSAARRTLIWRRCHRRRAGE